MEKMVSKNFKLYYIPNRDVAEDIYYEFYKLKIEEHLKSTLETYGVKENIDYITQIWLEDILGTCDCCQNNLANLEYYIQKNISIYEDRKASSPNDLQAGHYYMDYMDDTPYICERI